MQAASLTLYDLVDKYKARNSKAQDSHPFTLSAGEHHDRTPVKSLADLKGMETQGRGTQADVIKRLGGIPVAMPSVRHPGGPAEGRVKGMSLPMEVLKDFNYAAYTANATITNCGWSALRRDEQGQMGVAADDVKRCLTGCGRNRPCGPGRMWTTMCWRRSSGPRKNTNLQLFELPANERARNPQVVGAHGGRLCEESDAPACPATRSSKTSWR